MKNILKSIIFTLTAGASLLLMPANVLAVDVITPVCDGKNNINNSQVCQDDLTESDSNPIFGPEGILTRAISIMSIIVGVVAIIIIIIAGLKFITSQGNPQTITTARNQIIYAAVGIVVAGLAQGLVTFVLKRL